MPEIHKSKEHVPKISRLSLLKARIVDRIQRHKEKDKKIDHKTSISTKEVKKVASKSSVTPEKKSISTAKPDTKDASHVVVEKKKTQGPKRPIEQVLVGSWNALKQIPEKQGKGIVNIYDKLRFPKLTTEEQKVNDKVHVFLKKYQKEIGWGVTGVEAAAVTYGVVKGFQYLKKRRLQKELAQLGVSIEEIPSVQGDETSMGEIFSKYLKHLLEGESKQVRKSVHKLQDVLRRPARDEEVLGKIPQYMKDGLPLFAVRFYSFAEKNNVAARINSLSDYESQRSSLFELMQQFFQQVEDAVRQDESGDEQGVGLGVILSGRVLEMIGYPGLEELGVRFKPKPLA